MSGRIVRNPAIMLGKPCILGTRITVRVLLERLAAGQTLRQVAELYELPVQDVQAAVDFAIEEAPVSEEGPLFVARSAELEVASQGVSAEEARANLREAVELLLDFPED